VVDSGFWTNGCAATIACGSISTEWVKGKSVTDALAVTAEDIAAALVDLPEGISTAPKWRPRRSSRAQGLPGDSATTLEELYR